MRVRRIKVRASSGAYEVVCAAGAVSRLDDEIARLGKFTSVHVVTSPKVWRAVGKAVLRGLARHKPSEVHLFDDREAKKEMRSVEQIARLLARAKADRRSLILAVGGGVVGDVVGYAAASYLRGVALVQIPTTLVSQTDSSVGGKTGVNLPEGKNLVGAFYPARLVVVDPQLLKTLSKREFRGGLAEVIKYGIIADAKLFEYLEENFERALRRDEKVLEYLICRSIEIKAWVVSKDERESGLREILNYGHTFGHALESETRYRRFQHGEAVAWGMKCAALLGHKIGLTRASDVSRIVALIERLGPLPDWSRVSDASLIEAMKSDKKTVGNKLRFVLSKKIGKAATYENVPLDAVKHALHFAPRLHALTEIVSG
ncbi:MAG: 3-dehydroquinate synthase [Acidobacteria bacterium]|nr:3-dehydroquinate synthase [Acidobacteriota bacterium]MBS1866540.1 3-dehydroquinate synthase [Acidobacteriota bacterium]